MGDGRWEMGDGRWEMGDGRWEMGDGGLILNFGFLILDFGWERRRHGGWFFEGLGGGTPPPRGGATESTCKMVTLECGSPAAAFAETALLSGFLWVDVLWAEAGFSQSDVC